MADQKSAADKPLISVVMPAYNAEKFIGRAIESVLKQTYANLELVICNDASTDKTCEVIESYDDPRIVLCHEESNTGSAYLPRQRAFDHSRGEIIVELDADDYLEEQYIEKAYTRLAECSADICCCKMVFVDGHGAAMKGNRSIPGKGFDYSLQLTGREAYFKTVPDWIIGMNGCMAKRGAWDYGCRRTYKPGKRGYCDDENLGRFWLLWAKCVVFCEANYYYTVHDNSITHVFNKRIFESMTAQEDLLSLIGEDFGKDSREYKAVERKDYKAYRGALLRFAISINTVPKDEVEEYITELKKWYDRLNWKEVRDYVGFPQCLLRYHFFTECLFLLLRLKKRLSRK